jgi:hypothetical protein
MGSGVSDNKRRLHRVGYFGELMSTNAGISDAVRPPLNLSRGMIRRWGKLEYDLVSSLERDPLLRERLRRLRTVPGVGSIIGCGTHFVSRPHWRRALPGGRSKSLPDHRRQSHKARSQEG